jgi:predicted TIM-barrel fold metal-dependent hydrolase
MKKKLLITAIVGVLLVAFGVIYPKLTHQPGYINMHEHMENEEDVEVLLEINKELGIEKTVLVGSSDKTIYLHPTFKNYDENNDELLKIRAKYPDEFEVLCTTYWNDPDQVAKIEECYKRGAIGVKLYNGHGNFYEIPLDDPKMIPVYQYIQDNGLLLLFHVNSNKYLDEFERVLQKFPDMKTICPHFCLISRKLDVLSELMDKYPNLYTDTSFGYIEYTAAGFNRFSKDPNRFQKFMDQYQDRIFFGTDQVVTNVKTQKYVHELKHVFDGYLKMLTDEQFHLQTFWPEFYDETYRGLNLPEDTLQNILIDAPQRLLDSVPAYEEPAEESALE